MWILTLLSTGEPRVPSSRNRTLASGEGILALPWLRPDTLHRDAEASDSSWRQHGRESRGGDVM